MRYVDGFDLEVQCTPGNGVVRFLYRFGMQSAGIMSTQPGEPTLKFPGWQQLSGQEQRQLVSLMQNPAAFSQLLALQQAMVSLPDSTLGQHPSSTQVPFARGLPSAQCNAIHQHAPMMQQLSHALPPLLADRQAAPLQSYSSPNRPLPSPPQFDRSLLHAPQPHLASVRQRNEPVNLLAAQALANQRSRPNLSEPTPSLASFNSDLFRSSSLGDAYGSSSLPAELSAELSLRATSMPGSYHDIATRLHLNRAGINTATTSMIPVLSQDWLAVPFGTAQQLLPMSAGDMWPESDGEPVMLIDETGQNWPMKCNFSRYATLFWQL